MTIEEKLELFKDSAIAEASHQSSVMLAEYRQTLEKMYESRVAAANQSAQEYIITETDRIRREHNRALSMEQNKIKRDIGEKHHRVKEKIFADVEQMLRDYMGTEAYTRSLMDRIGEIKRFARGQEVRIYVDPSDAEKLPALEAETQMKLTVSDTPFMGGVRAVLPAKNILMDYSFATRLAEEKNNFTI